MEAPVSHISNVTFVNNSATLGGLWRGHPARARGRPGPGGGGWGWCGGLYLSRKCQARVQPFDCRFSYAAVDAATTFVGNEARGGTGAALYAVYPDALGVVCADTRVYYVPLLDWRRESTTRDLLREVRGIRKRVCVDIKGCCATGLPHVCHRHVTGMSQIPNITTLHAGLPPRRDVERKTASSVMNPNTCLYVKVRAEFRVTHHNPAWTNIWTSVPAVQASHQRTSIVLL
eukprot:229564-Chlamydomonas_euryale.AAC.2